MYGVGWRNLIFVDMKHESIVVVYDSCEAIAEEIADKLGAETVSVQSMNIRQIENSQSLVFAVEFQADGQLTSHWMYAYLTLRGVNLKGKNIAVQALPPQGVNCPFLRCNLLMRSCACPLIGS